jgi:hypothetical protein
MELSHQPYTDVICMPVKKMYDYLKWKNSLEDSKRKLMEEKASDMRSKQRNRK